MVIQTQLSAMLYIFFEGYINNIELTAVYFKFEVERVLGGYSTLSPNATYDVNCQCRKFKDERCGYTGTETACDKTHSRCKALGNIGNLRLSITAKRNGCWITSDKVDLKILEEHRCCR